MIRHPDPPPRSLPLRVAIIIIGASVVLAVVGIVLTARAASGSRETLSGEVRALEEQVRTMCASTPDPASCKPVTQAPIILVVPPSTVTTTTTTTVPFPPSTLGTSANPPASAAERPSPAPEPSTTTTTAPPPPPTTTPPTTTPCTTLPAVGCVNGRASRSGTRLDWDALRRCESGGDYMENTGNGYYGAYQFSADTWHGLGYDGLPSDAAPDVQDEAARLLYSQRGAQPWPTCGARL